MVKATLDMSLYRYTIEYITLLAQTHHRSVTDTDYCTRHAQAVSDLIIRTRHHVKSRHCAPVSGCVAGHVAYHRAHINLNERSLAAPVAVPQDPVETSHLQGAQDARAHTTSRTMAKVKQNDRMHYAEGRVHA